MFEGLRKKFSNFINSVAKKEEEKQAVEEKVEEEKAIEHKAAEIKPVKEHPAEPVPQKEAKISATTRIKGLIFRKVTIQERDVDELLENFKLSLLESDVNYEVAEKITESIRKKLVGASVDSKDIGAGINGMISDALLEVLKKGTHIDLVELAKNPREKPLRILFLGPNGAGKTTTIAKVANLLLKNNVSCVLSASDTFRAAAIEQIAHHADKLGVRVIKSSYGADPASVAFDAIAYAKAHGVDAVLIDSAGRQETNRSLIEEMKKIVRIAKPDLKIFVGEGIAGNSLLEQVKQFDSAVKLDGVILTKLDVDAKGGNTISILSETSIPILFFGMGEKYTDLMPYAPEIVVSNIMKQG